MIFFLERITNSELTKFYKKTFNRVIVLKNEIYDYEYLDDNGINSLKIFGTPYCKIFGNWAFMVSDEKLKQKYSEMPLNCDIVISHDSPSINNLGTIQEGWQKGVNAGNFVLAEEIKIKKPKYFFSGHIHSGNHNFENVDGTIMANVSLVNEKYNPVFDILKFEI